MKLIHSIFTENILPVTHQKVVDSSQEDNIYTLENLMQTLEEAAQYLAIEAPFNKKLTTN